MVKIEKLVEKINNDEEYRNFLKEKKQFHKEGYNTKTTISI